MIYLKFKLEYVCYVLSISTSFNNVVVDYIKFTSYAHSSVSPHTVDYGTVIPWHNPTPCAIDYINLNLNLNIEQNSDKMPV